MRLRPADYATSKTATSKTATSKTATSKTATSKTATSKTATSKTATSRVENPPEAAAPSLSRSPQPRPLGLLLALLGCALLVAFALVAVMGAQCARVNAALTMVRELRPPPTHAYLDFTTEPSSTERLEKIVSLNSFIESYRSWDRLLQSIGPLLGVAGRSSPPLFLEEQLIARIELAEGALSTASVGDSATGGDPATKPSLRIAAVLITPLQLGSDAPSQLHTLMSDVSSATEDLKELRNEIAQVETALSELKETLPSLLERANLLHLQARRVLLLPEAIPTPPGFVESAGDIESLLYQSGMLRGVPIIEGLPDGIETPEALVQGVAALGAQSSEDTSRSPQEAQQELNTLTSAALALWETVQSAAAKERTLVSVRSALYRRAREQLEQLRKYWLEVIERSLTRYSHTLPLP